MPLSITNCSSNQGVLHIKDLQTILDPHHYPPAKNPFIIQMMRKFEMCMNFRGAGSEISHYRDSAAGAAGLPDDGKIPCASNTATRCCRRASSPVSSPGCTPISTEYLLAARGAVAVERRRQPGPGPGGPGGPEIAIAVDAAGRDPPGPAEAYPVGFLSRFISHLGTWK